MSNFETWWEREGQEFMYALNTTTDDDIKLVAKVAWKNGAYCAEQAEQEPVAVISESAIGLVKLHSNGVCLPFGTQLYAAPVSVEAIRSEALEEAVELCDRFAKRQMHPAECAAAIRGLK